MKPRHLATYGLVGVLGRRVGTGYCYTPEQVRAHAHHPWFRFRNAEAERSARPDKGESE